MKQLLDAHLLLWVAAGPEKLSLAALQAVEDPQNQLLFSPVSLWEVAIKRALGHSGFIRSDSHHQSIVQQIEAVCRTVVGNRYCCSAAGEMRGTIDLPRPQ